MIPSIDFTGENTLPKTRELKFTTDLFDLCVENRKRVVEVTSSKLSELADKHNKPILVSRNFGYVVAHNIWYRH